MLARADGFHDLRTVYQTIALHDVIRVSVGRGSGIEILCKNKDPRVPLDSSNTCYRMAELVLEELGAKGRVSIEIEKRLPVQGGLGAASSNAVATMVALERALRTKLSGTARLRIAADVGSDLPLFLVGGTALGVGRGEEVYPLADLPSLPMVVVMPEVGVSTAQAFADWDALVQREEAAELRSAWTGEGARPHTTPPHTESAAELRSAGQPRAAVPTRIWTGGGARRSIGNDELTRLGASDRLFEVGCVLSAWLSGLPNTGAPAKGGSRAGNLLLDLVRTGIENDFEKVVFPLISRIARHKRCAGARGVEIRFALRVRVNPVRAVQSRADAAKAVSRLRKQGSEGGGDQYVDAPEVLEEKSLVADCVGCRFMQL